MQPEPGEARRADVADRPKHGRATISRSSHARRVHEAADERWFLQLRTVAMDSAYRSALALCGDEERAAGALVAGFRDAWRTRYRRPAGRRAADWVVGLVERRARRSRRFHRRPSTPPPAPWQVVVPADAVMAINDIAVQRHRFPLLRARLAALGAALALAAGLAMLAYGLASVVHGPSLDHSTAAHPFIVSGAGIAPATTSIPSPGR